MKILHVFGRMTRHGAQLRTLDITALGRAQQRGLAGSAPQRHDFCSLSGAEGELDSVVRSQGGEVHYVPVYSLKFPVQFFRLLRANNYDVVHSHVHYSSGIIVLIAKLAGVRGRITHFRNTTTGVGASLLARIASTFKMFLISRLSTDILAVSKSSMTAAWGDRVRDDPRCRVVYNGLAQKPRDHHADRQSVIEELGLGADARIVMHLGRFDPQKNQMKCVTVFQKLLDGDPNYVLLFAGDTNGLEYEPITVFIREHGLQDKVRFLGIRDDPLRLLSAADLMLFPSRWEGLPGTVLETLSVGTQVLGSDIEPIKEVSTVTDGVSYLPLDADDERWAAQAELLIKATGADSIRASIVDSFKIAPFNLDTATEQHQRIWKKYQPAAGSAQ